MNVNDEIFRLVKGEKSLSEISRSTSLSNRDVYKNILNMQRKGYVIDSKILDSGDIKYFTSSKEKIHNNTVDLSLVDSSKFKALVIADTHIGSITQRLEYLDIVYEFAHNNDIHIIINAGDLIDGNFGPLDKFIPEITDQLDFVIKNHPYSEDILNLICLGNHDYSAFDDYIDIRKVLTYYREDLIPIGFGISIINILNDQIIVKHPINDLNLKNVKSNLALCGHTHKMAANFSENGLEVFIPALCNMQFNDDLPGFVKMNLSLKDGSFIHGHFDSYAICNSIFKASEIDTDFPTSIEGKTLIKQKI